jgi:tetratricopeptide (TPR) repeat protein
LAWTLIQGCPWATLSGKETFSCPALICPNLHRFKEAVNECTSALEVDGSYAKALIRRSKAYEGMHHYKQALNDIQKANKVDSANPDTLVRSSK